MKKLFIILMVSIFISCSRANVKTEKLVFNRQIIQITIDSIEKLDFGNNSEITFKLWGYDLYMGDGSAVLLKEYKYNLSKLPVTYGIDYPKESNKKIKPNGSGEYGYYITLKMENKDGKHYEIDYEATDKDYFEKRKTKIEQLSGRIFIEEIQ